MTRIIEHGRVLICIRASAIICCMHLAAPFIELNILGSINARTIEDIDIYLPGSGGPPVPRPHYSHLHANWVRIYTHILLFCVISLDQHTSKELLYQIKDITGRLPLLLMISLWQIYPLLCDRLIKGFL